MRNCSGFLVYKVFINMNLKETIRRVLKETLLNESIFFRRRVNLDIVKRLLPINAEQVYYETSSFEQFKYELTLKAVESIMWNNYKISWEDLPEQEEIDFVTKISDVFENTIKHLYRLHHNK
jgi:hypothetical protein